ncbi:MAG: hypothetical protein IT307_18470 [Chloroflexi bacterium]|nr:hypothetical protein [Chloroflexota bacterium]
MIATAPTCLPVLAENIPTELQERAAWVVWRLTAKPDKPGEFTKIPYRATAPGVKASSTDATTWSTFEAAHTAYQQHTDLSGIGLVLNGDGVAGLDIDYGLTDSGQIKPWAMELLQMLPGAYVERSPSGKGLRAIFRATLPPGRRKAPYQDGIVEMYDTGRFLTITGQVVDL